MRLNHLDLHVPDVAATRDFFVSVFDFTEIETGRANGRAILRDDAGLELVVSRPADAFGGADSASVGRNTYHIGFVLPSREAVDAQFERVNLAGCEICKPPSAVRGGWLFYCFAPGQVLIEVSWRPEPIANLENIISAMAYVAIFVS
ncbi:VOC family protein [Rhizobium mayense]|uniref:VOC family protein n=1 Tax=Rhizobium mayense TaxID=1312184 RepID=A0ABT7JQR1_9HYPH|nr:VOC family protein [Rhizobium mayense]MDL2398682.1 VOC family protein [Rhizobium mayense]